ncbi:MAG: helix-turn-helix domain-containing protein [Syntrophobacteraceae bacterium]
MGTITNLKLTEEQLDSLLELADSNTEPRIAKRALVVLMASEGMSLREISARVGLGWQSCLKWRKRFLEQGVEGLLDEPRAGRPAIFDVKKQRNVINRVLLSIPEDGSNHWSSRKLASASGLSKSTIHRVLNGLSFKPQKVNYWHDGISATILKSQKPDFLGFYFFYSAKAVAFSLYKEKFLIASLKDPLKGRELRHPAEEKFWNFLEHLRGLYRHDEIYLIVNNYEPDRHDKILEWASRLKRSMRFYFTPPHFSWLDQVDEVLGHYYRIKKVKGRSAEEVGWHRLEEELLRQLRHELKEGDKFHAEPREWMCPGRELLPF